METQDNSAKLEAIEKEVKAVVEAAVNGVNEFLDAFPNEERAILSMSGEVKEVHKENGSATVAFRVETLKKPEGPGELLEQIGGLLDAHNSYMAGIIMLETNDEGERIVNFTGIIRNELCYEGYHSLDSGKTQFHCTNKVGLSKMMDAGYTSLYEYGEDLKSGKASSDGFDEVRISDEYGEEAASEPISLRSLTH